jgi:peptidoglycan/xylan/chitin deacetylase (PgdA/CDA1 family)
MYFVSSWDDGHPLDEKVAEMHLARGLKATFYVPLHNREGLPTIGVNSLRAIDCAGFEIGSHTADHCYLDTACETDAANQIIEGKAGLEAVLGHAVSGFCYPGGRRPKFLRSVLKAAGISYARTVENLRTDLHFDNFEVPTTLQFYPHRWPILLANATKSPTQLARKLLLLNNYRRLGGNLSAIADLAVLARDVNEFFHVWGHSWEVEKMGAWGELGKLLDVAKTFESSLTVSELAGKRVAREVG